MHGKPCQHSSTGSDPAANASWSLDQGSTANECPEIGVQLVDCGLEILRGDFLILVRKLLAEHLAHDPDHGLVVFSSMSSASIYSSVS